MKPNELYALEPIGISRDIFPLDEYLRDLYLSEIEEEANERIELRYYARTNFDGRRGWYLFSVWFDDKPVMICQGAGRELRDFNNSFVTDWDTYTEMTKYIASLIPPEEDPNHENLISPDEDHEGIDSFYGSKLNSFYDATLEPKYKVGDLMDVSVREDHLSWDNKSKIVVRVLVHSVNKFNPSETYHGTQVDRVVGPWIQGQPTTFETDYCNGSLGAQFNDADVQGHSKDQHLTEKWREDV